MGFSAYRFKSRSLEIVRSKYIPPSPRDRSHYQYHAASDVLANLLLPISHSLYKSQELRVQNQVQSICRVPGLPATERKPLFSPMTVRSPQSVGRDSLHRDDHHGREREKATLKNDDEASWQREFCHERFSERSGGSVWMHLALHDYPAGVSFLLWPLSRSSVSHPRLESSQGIYPSRHLSHIPPSRDIWEYHCQLIHCSRKGYRCIRTSCSAYSPRDRVRPLDLPVAGQQPYLGIYCEGLV